MIENLLKWYALADDIDRREGGLAYQRYHELMQLIARKHSVELHRVVAAFVALSPNNAYVENVRSLLSCLRGLEAGVPDDKIVVTTYKHCRERALLYLRGTPFLDHAKGLKTRAFYANVLDPENSRDVTVDGHMWGVWVDQPLTMKEAKVPDKKYRQVETAVQLLASAVRRRPHEVQATLWFARKRVLRVLYKDQLSLFAGDDQWGTALDPSLLRPY